MTINTRERFRIYITLVLISALTWMMLLVNPGGIMTIAHCPITDAGASPASFQMLLAMNPISSLATGWALMLVAMMSPTLIAPVRHIIERSFKRRRARSVMLFVIGYAAIWMAAGIVMLAAVLMLNLFFPQSYLPAFAVGMIALVWQCSPVKQRCLNRNHNHTELAAFGRAADRDALRFGVTHGIWCAGSCWTLMLFPMLLAQGHFVAMAAVTFVMTSERLEQPRPLGWRLRFPGKLIRIVVAQTRIRLQRLSAGSGSSTSAGLDS
jgi:predicted metal-binding membrane protein